MDNVQLILEVDRYRKLPDWVFTVAEHECLSTVMELFHVWSAPEGCGSCTNFIGATMSSVNQALGNRDLCPLSSRM